MKKPLIASESSNMKIKKLPNSKHTTPSHRNNSYSFINPNKYVIKSPSNLKNDQVQVLNSTRALKKKNENERPYITNKTNPAFLNNSSKITEVDNVKTQNSMPKTEGLMLRGFPTTTFVNINDFINGNGDARERREAEINLRKKLQTIDEENMKAVPELQMYSILNFDPNYSRFERISNPMKYFSFYKGRQHSIDPTRTDKYLNTNKIVSTERRPNESNIPKTDLLLYRKPILKSISNSSYMYKQLTNENDDLAKKKRMLELDKIKQKKDLDYYLEYFIDDLGVKSRAKINLQSVVLKKLNKYVHYTSSKLIKYLVDQVGEDEDIEENNNKLKNKKQYFLSENAINMNNYLYNKYYSKIENKKNNYTFKSFVKPSCDNVLSNFNEFDYINLSLFESDKSCKCLDIRQYFMDKYLWPSGLETIPLLHLPGKLKFCYEEKDGKDYTTKKPSVDIKKDKDQSKTQEEYYLDKLHKYPMIDFEFIPGFTLFCASPLEAKIGRSDLERDVGNKFDSIAAEDEEIKHFKDPNLELVRETDIFELFCSLAKKCETDRFKYYYNIYKDKLRLKMKNKNGSTLMIIAAKYNCLEICEFLYSVGSDVKDTNKYGNTALHYAAMNKNVKLINFLTERGCNAELKNNKKQDVAKIWDSNSQPEDEDSD